jgi:hypothetical protein
MGVGMLVDRRGRADFMIVAVMLFIGTAGYLALAQGSVVWFAIGTVLAFGAGWGWNGAANHAIVSMNKRNPGTASGLAMMGMALGGVVWPMAFGLIVTHVNFRTAWIATAGLSLTSAILSADGAQDQGRGRERVDGRTLSRPNSFKHRHRTTTWTRSPRPNARKERSRSRREPARPRCDRARRALCRDTDFARRPGRAHRRGSGARSWISSRPRSRRATTTLRALHRVVSEDMKAGPVHGDRDRREDHAVACRAC